LEIPVNMVVVIGVSYRIGPVVEYRVAAAWAAVAV